MALENGTGDSSTQTTSLLRHSKIPLQFLNNEDRATGIDNPAYTEWELREQLLLARLQSSLSPTVLAKVIGCRFTWQLWEKVHHYLHAKIKAQARQLKSELKHEERHTIARFFVNIKKIVDALLSIGEVVSAQEQVDVILQGLPTEFESIVTLIAIKLDWFEFDEIKSLLLVHENRVTKQTEIVNGVDSLNLTKSSASVNSSTTAGLQQSSGHSSRSLHSRPWSWWTWRSRWPWWRPFWSR